jgi:hypothetical protein
MTEPKGANRINRVRDAAVLSGLLEHDPAALIQGKPLKKHAQKCEGSFTTL